MRAAGFEQPLFGDRAGRDKAHDIAPHDRFRPALARLRRILELLADRDAMPLPDQPLQIIVGAIDGHAAHGDVFARMLAALRQHDAERARGDLGIVEEQFVEIAHPVEQQRIRIGALLISRYCAIIGEARGGASPRDARRRASGPKTTMVRASADLIRGAPGRRIRSARASRPRNANSLWMKDRLAMVPALHEKAPSRKTMADTKKGPKRPTFTDREALLFHSEGRPGKLEVVATKPMATQRDLSLAYSPGVAVPVLAIAEDPSRAYDYTVKGNMVGRHHQRHRHSRARQSRRARLETGDGRQGRPLQALRRHRFDRSRSRYRGSGGIHQRRQLSRPDLRRHQSRGHQGAGVLHHRGAPARIDEHPGLPRRPARHGDHRGRRHDQRDASDRARHQDDAARLQRRGRGRHRLPRPAEGARACRARTSSSSIRRA